MNVWHNFSSDIPGQDLIFDPGTALLENGDLLYGTEPEQPLPTFFLPYDLTVIEENAFRGIAAEAVFIPAGVTVIEGNPFGQSHVTHIYGVAGSAAQTLADTYGFIFVPVEE